MQGLRDVIKNLQDSRVFTRGLHDDLVKKHKVLANKVEALVDVLIASGTLVEVGKEQGGLISKSIPVIIGSDYFGPICRSSEKYYIVAATKKKVGE